MSLAEREEPVKVSPERKRTFETAAAERQRAMGRASISAQLQNAEYKDSISMELDAREEFLIKNKAFFRKELRMGRKDGH